jgi:hypothetical protein
LTSIEHGLFESVRLGSHESLDGFTTFQKMTKQTRHDTGHMLDKSLDSGFLPLGHEFRVFKDIMINGMTLDLKPGPLFCSFGRFFQNEIGSTQIEKDDNAWLETFKIENTDGSFLVAGLGLNDRSALLVGLSFSQRIVIFIVFVKIGFERPSTGQDINGLLVMDKSSNHIEDFSLLASIENLRQACKGDS